MLETKARLLSPCSSSMDGMSKVWKEIWKIKTPNKIRHFIWRAAHDSLPTKQNLRHQHVPVEASCSLCDEHAESLIHCLWLCDHAQAVRKSDSCFARYYRKQYQSFLELLGEVMCTGSGFHVALFFTISWCLWQRRNRLRENQPTWLLKEDGDRARALVLEFFEACQSDSGPSVSAAPVCWSRPSEGFYKVNFDAALFESSGCAGTGVAIRDSDGEIIAALSQSYVDNLRKLKSQTVWENRVSMMI